MSRASVTRSVNGTVSSTPLVLAICAISAALFFVIGWAAVTRVPELVRAPGQIGPVNDLDLIDHFDGGVVQALMVNPGDRVQQGDLLAVITEPNLRGEIAAAEQRAATLERDRYRLETVLTGLDAPDRAAPEIPDETEDDSALSAYIASQDHLFRARRDTMETRIERLGLSIAGAEALYDTARARLEIADADLAQYQRLFADEVISQSELSAQQDTWQQVQQSVLEAEMQLLQARDRLQEAQGELAEAETTWREELVARLYEVDGELDALAVQLSEMQLRADRAELYAPRDGVIQTIQADAVGQVVPPGGTVMEMLASGEALVAVIRLTPKDIGHVFVGAPVSIRPTTFDFRRYGDISGEVVSIAPTSQLDETHHPYFRTVVALDRSSIGTGAAERALHAGMEVSADISTSERTVLSYFFKPAERVLAVSLTER